MSEASSATDTAATTRDDEIGAAVAAGRAAIQAARAEAAIASLEPLLDQPLTASQQVEVLYTLAVARRYRRDFDGALEGLDSLLALEPAYSRAHQEQGHTLLAMNRAEDAARAFSRAAELNPGLAASWRALAGLHVQAGRQEAAALAQSQVEYLDSLPRELAGAIELLHDGRLYKAEQVCRRFLRAHPHDVEAMRLLAEIGVRLRIYDDAEFLLESCVELAPHHTRARMDYLAVLNRKGKYGAALEQATRLVTEQPGHPAFELALAAALAGLGRLDEAIARYRQCLEDSPNKASVLVLLGHAQKAVGATGDAIASYREAHALRPDYGDAYWSLANTKTYRFSDTEIDQMRRSEAAPATAFEDRVHLDFALGKAFEDRDIIDESFAYYARGNALKYQRSGYDPELTCAMVDAQIEHCTETLFAQRGQAGCSAPDPIFIVGLPRAGSTLLEQILASHSMVDGTMELHDILSLVQRLRGRSAARESNYPRNLAELDEDYFRRFGEQFIENTRAYRGGAPLFIDKMPNNFMHIGLIRLILPNAKVIDARRHPIACCFSGYKQLFGEGQDFSYDLTAIGRYYRDYVRLMDHWDRVLPGFVLRVQHESVVTDLDAQLRRMLDFCGLPFERSCIEFHRTRRSVRTPSSEQVRQPIYRSGLGRWRRFSDYLEPLRAALGTEILERYKGVDG